MPLTPVQQKFEELFNVPQAEYDPLKPSALPARAPSPHLDLTSQIDPSAGAAAPGAEDFFAAFDGLTPETPTEEVGYPTALGRSFRAGIQDVGALGLGMAEYGARQTALTHESGAVRSLARDATGALSAGRQSLQANAQELMASLTPEQQQQAAQQIFTLDPDKTIFRDDPFNVVQALGLKLSRMAPPTLTTLIPGAVLARVATAPAAIAYMSASEAGMSIGGIQNEIANEIEALPEEQLAAIPAYAQMVESGMDPVGAKQRLIAEAQGQAPLVGGLAVAAISSVAGRFFTPIFEKGGGANIVQRFGRGYAAEAPQEAGQGGVEQYAANIAAQLYDKDRSEMQGVLSAAGEEGVLGGIFGGAVAAVAGQGPQPQTLPPDPVQSLPAGPESFEQVFGQGGEDPLARVSEPAIAERTALPSPQELEAAGQQSMYLPLPGEEQMQGQLSLGVPQPLRDVNRQAVVAAPASPQMTLPMQRRRRGGFDQVPDVPSAEPAGDIIAQLGELEEGNRQAVYLSADNLARMGEEANELVEFGIGVPIENFDGEGGLLIARDDAAARQLTQMRDSGATPMQEILGLATGAGTGKPADGDTAVQRRDEAGNVLQESLVPEREADALVRRWSQEFPGDEVVVLTPDEVIARRDGRISEETQARTGDLLTGFVPPVKTGRRPMEATRQIARRAAEDQVATKVEEAAEAEQLTGEIPTAPTETRAAAKLIARGVGEAAVEKARRVGGFFPPKQLVFQDQGQRDRYASAFDELVTDELTITEIEQEYAGKARPPDVVARYKQAHDTRKKTRELLKRIRTVARPTRRSEAALRAAERVSPNISKQVRDEASRVAKEPIPEEDLKTGFEESAEEDERVVSNLLPETVETMHGQTLDEAFYRAARVSAGKKAYTKYTYVRGSGATAAKGDATAADEVAETIVAADQIPEGAEPVAYTRDAPVSTRRPVTVDKVVKVGKDRWRYVLKQEGQSDIRGAITAPDKAAAEAHAAKIADTHNQKVRERDDLRGMSFEQILEANRSPSLKRKTINRVAAQLRRREHGGKVKALPVTKTAKRVGTTERPRDESTGVFDTGVLTRDTTKQDESVEDRAKRQARARTARSTLVAAIDKATGEMNKLLTGKFAELANEQGSDGLWTPTAMNIHYGRMYLRQVMEFGRALINSEIDSASAHKQMEAATDFINSALTLTPEGFANKMSSVARADIREAIMAKSAKGDIGLLKLKAQLSDPTKRVEAMNEWNARVRKNVENFLRLTEAWRKDDVFASTVEPIMRKFTASTLRDGYPSYQPTRQELEAIDWALQHWHDKTEHVVVPDGKNKIDLGTQHDVFYAPIRRFFTDLGYEFQGSHLVSPAPQTDMLSFLPAVRKEIDQHPLGVSPKSLEKLYRNRYAGQEEAEAGGGVSIQIPTVELEYGERKGTGPRTVVEKVKLQTARAGALPERSVSTIYKEHQRAMERMRFAKNQGERNAIIEQETVWHSVNRIIAAFREQIAHPQITVEGLLRQERRLIGSLKELGVWRDTPSPAIGAITLPGSGLETKPVNIAGPRLKARTLTKEKARTMMAKLAPFKLPEPGEGLYKGREAQQIATRVTTAAQKPLKSETLDYQQLGVQKHGDAFLNTAVELKSMLNESTQTGHALLDKIIETVPAGHPYHEIAQVMRRLNSSNVFVQWSQERPNFLLPNTSLGRFRPKLGDIVINKAGLDALNVATDSNNAAAATIHVVLHELSHASTQQQLKNDRKVAHEFGAMQRIARRILQARGEALPYGLRHKDPVDEFVAEVFTNTAFQEQLATIKMEQQQKSVLQAIWDYVKGLFGRPANDTMLDLAFAKTDRVFSDQAHAIRDDAAEQVFDLENVDAVSKVYIRGAVNRLVETGRFRRALAAGKWAGVRAPLSLMTLGQIRNEFKARVEGLDEYYRAFKNRDARNSEMLERAERLSREWTKLTEKDGTTQATRFSELATLSTVHDLHPDKPLSDPANKHVKLDEQKAHHKELRAEFEQLPQPWKNHYAALQKYYQEVLRREAVLLTQNALRAVLTKGKNPPMESARFESTYTYDKLASLTTEEALRAEFGEYLDEDMLKTVSAMRTLPAKRTGPYFPIMRYGDYVVEGKSERATERFATTKEAQTRQAQLLADDPTLVVEMTRLDGGAATLKVSERTFLLSESATEAQIKREELLEEYDHVSAVTKKLEYGTESTIRSNEALGRILDNLEGNAAAQAAMRQYYLRTLSDSSFRKHEIKRKMRRGFDSKLQHRNFTNYAQAASYYTAQLEFGWKMSQAMTKMVAAKNKVEGDSREGVRISEVVQSIQQRDKLSADPTVVNDLVRKGVSFAQFTMLTSPSYWMINATQPYMVSLPYMAAKHPMGAVIGSMRRAQKLILHPLVGQAWNTKAGLAAFWSKAKTEEAFNVLDDVKASIKKKVGDEKAKPILDMLDALRRESILDLSWIAELRDIAEGRDTGLWQKTLDASRVMSHLTEVNNRILTAIAAYDLASQKGTHEQAVEYAKDVVQQTHFDYSSGNKPILFRPDGPLGAAAPLVFQFMQWPQHMYAMLISNMVKVMRSKGVERKEAAKILGGLLGTHMLAGGLIGASLQPIKWAVGFAMMALGDDDEPYTLTNTASGATFDRLVQEGAATVVGPALAELLARGVPAKLGTDLSDRMALGTLYHMDLRTDNTESVLGSLATSVGGPWLTIGENGVRAVGDIMNGDIARGIERVAPKAVRDMFKTYRYASEGLVNNAGDTVIDATDMPPQQLFLQALGFGPAEVDQFYDRQSVIKDKERYGAERRDAMVARFVRASTPDERKEALREVVEFNRAFPAARITRSTLMQSMQSARTRERSYRRYGANISDKERRYADEGWYFE